MHPLGLQFSLVNLCDLRQMPLQTTFQDRVRVNRHRETGVDTLLHENLGAAAYPNQPPPAGFKQLAKLLSANCLQTVISMI